MWRDGISAAVDWSTLWNFTATALQAVSAIAVAGFTFALLRIERQRDRQGEAPLISVKAPAQTAYIDLGNKDALLYDPEKERVWSPHLFVRNLGQGPALRLEVNWSPTDASGKPEYFLPASTLSERDSRLSIAPASVVTINFRISYEIEDLNFQPGAVQPIIQPSQMGPLRVGTHYDLGLLTIRWVDRSGWPASVATRVGWRRVRDQGNKRESGQVLILASTST